MNGQNDETKLASRRTVFHEILNSSLAPEEKTLVRLKHEAASITGAGIDTTKTTLALATFYILDQPEVYERLHNELVEAIPDPSRIPPLTELEKLPYLSAIIQECMSLSPTENLVSSFSRADLYFLLFTI
jgi:cytochrome P450